MSMLEDELPRALTRSSCGASLRACPRVTWRPALTAERPTPCPPIAWQSTSIALADELAIAASFPPPRGGSRLHEGIVMNDFEER